MTDAGDDAGDGRWMTYGQLADARGISLRAAVRLTQRHHLRRQPGNDGKTLVLVPPDVVQPPDSRATRRRANGVGGASDAGAVAGGAKEGLSADIMTLREALVAVRQATDSEIATLRTAYDQALAQLTDAQAARDRAEAALAGERTRADALRDRLDAAQAELRQAQDAAEEARQAEAARRAQGLLARLRAAWRGE